nr:MAG TPA_asm: hypothetical protein [Caudoviricetes sp.]
MRQRNDNQLRGVVRKTPIYVVLCAFGCMALLVCITINFLNYEKSI